MIPRRNRDLPFGRNSFLFSHKRRYNGNCAPAAQQAKAASSMMTCTLSARRHTFVNNGALRKELSPTGDFLSLLKESYPSETK